MSRNAFPISGCRNSSDSLDRSVAYRTAREGRSPGGRGCSRNERRPRRLGERADVYLSTLRAFVEAIGGKLGLVEAAPPPRRTPTASGATQVRGAST